jgi:hypothetical protein
MTSAITRLHWTRWLLIAVCMINVARVLTVHRVVSGKPSPFLSANDRSRWSTIRSLGDDNTFILDDVIFSPKTAKRDPKWYSIDLVRHKSSDGKEHFFSSKPTLMLVVLAGLYKVIAAVTSWRLATNTFAVSQVMLILVNVLPWYWLCWRMLKWIEEETSDSFARGCLSIIAIAGTFVTTFVVTLNNHLHGAVGLVLLIDQARIAAKSGGKLSHFILAGLGAGFLAINELPALSAITLAGALLLYLDWKKALLGYLPPILMFAAAAIGSNYIAHGSWKTPYAHRKDGPVITHFYGLMSDFKDQPIGDRLRSAARDKGIELSSETVISPRPTSGWVVWDPISENRFAVRKSPAGEQNEYELRAWDNWYEYEGSYWLPGVKKGVDLGEPSIARYAFHSLIGHYGIFLLTPFWVCSVLGAGIWLAGSSREKKLLAASIGLVTIVCLAFYIWGRPLEDRNYGGVACGFRWTFWLIPAWLLLAIPGAEKLSKSGFGRVLLVIFIAVSLFFAWYNYANPWTHSWVYQMVVARG